MVFGLETPFTEPHDFLFNMYHPKGTRNHAGVNDAKLTEMIEKQAKTLDKAERKKQIFEIQRYLGEQMYYPPNAASYALGRRSPRTSATSTRARTTASARRSSRSSGSTSRRGCWVMGDGSWRTTDSSRLNPNTHRPKTRTRRAPMHVYLARRLLLVIPTLLGVSIIVFLLVRLLPGDAVTMLLQEYAYAKDADEMRAKLGLDRPVYVQYVEWIGGVAARRSRDVAAQQDARVRGAAEADARSPPSSGCWRCSSGWPSPSRSA